MDTTTFMVFLYLIKCMLLNINSCEQGRTNTGDDISYEQERLTDTEDDMPPLESIHLGSFNTTETNEHTHYGMIQLRGSLHDNLLWGNIPDFPESRGSWSE